MVDFDLPVSAVVLCGGAGRRFDGRDKPLENLAGKPLVAHVLDRLEGQASSVVISANRNLNQYRLYGHPVIEDQAADRGPLCGIQTAACKADHDWLFVCPGDAPFLPADLIERLRSGFVAGSDVAVPHDGERTQHLFMLLERSTVERIEPYLAEGGRSVRGWLNTLRVVEVPVSDPAAFTNVNTAEELARAERLV